MLLPRRMKRTYTNNTVTGVPNLRGYCNLKGATETPPRMVWKNSYEAQKEITSIGKSQGRLSDAFGVYLQYHATARSPDVYVLTALLSACQRCNEPQKALPLIEEMEKMELLKGVIVKVMATICAETRDKTTALKLLALMKRTDFFQCSATDINMACTKLVVALCQQRADTQHAQELMDHLGIKPDAYTYTALLKVAAEQDDLQLGRTVHDRATITKVELTPALLTTLINMYGKCGHIQSANSIFLSITSKKDVFLWTAIIAANAQNSDGVAALRFYDQMLQEDVKPNQWTYSAVLKACANLKDINRGKQVHSEVLVKGIELEVHIGTALLDMYGKCGNITEACNMFDLLQRRKSLNVATWNAMITAYAHNNLPMEAINTFKRMKKERVQPDELTYATVVAAYSTMASPYQALQIHQEALDRKINRTEHLETSLLSMFSKCGKIEQASAIFKSLRERGSADLPSWNAMLHCYGIYGRGSAALSLFNDMKQYGLKPNSRTLVCILNCFSHAGLVEEALNLLHTMERDYNVTPEEIHYTCAVDALGRAGRLNEAENLIAEMTVPVSIITYTALLGACRIHQDLTRAERIAKKAMIIAPKDTSIYVLLSNMYATSGLWDHHANIRSLMKQQGIPKLLGKSWIEVGGKTHYFVVGDKTHPESEAIYAKLHQLHKSMKQEGYNPDLSWVMHDVDNANKETHLCGHSEKLAIAFGLLKTSPGTSLFIAKNLRECGDCHTATKFISLIEKREITVRDANRFHIFTTNGRCSCNDYF